LEAREVLAVLARSLPNLCLKSSGESDLSPDFLESSDLDLDLARMVVVADAEDLLREELALFFVKGSSIKEKSGRSEAREVLAVLARSLLNLCLESSGESDLSFDFLESSDLDLDLMVVVADAEDLLGEERVLFEDSFRNSKLHLPMVPVEARPLLPLNVGPLPCVGNVATFIYTGCGDSSFSQLKSGVGDLDGLGLANESSMMLSMNITSGLSTADGCTFSEGTSTSTEEATEGSD